MKCKMFALSNRIASVLLLTGLLIAPQAYAIDQEPVAGDEIPRVLALKPVEAPGTDTELRRLVKERYNATAAELNDLYALYSAGRAPLEWICSAIETFADAGSELAETPVARVSELELARNAAKAVEAITKGKFDEGQEPRHAAQHARACRLGIEIRLVRAREAAKAAREAK
jgi:hypothetical protein